MAIVVSKTQFSSYMMLKLWGLFSASLNITAGVTDNFSAASFRVYGVMQSDLLGSLATEVFMQGN